MTADLQLLLLLRAACEHGCRCLSYREPITQHVFAEIIAIIRMPRFDRKCVMAHQMAEGLAFLHDLSVVPDLHTTRLSLEAN